MAKYELIPQQLLHEGIITEENLFAPEPLEDAVILLTHDADYWHRLKLLELEKKEIRRIGFPLDAQLVEREQRICKGTIDCAHFALQYGVAFNTAGGTHHSGKDWGEGFCLLNDVAVAGNYLLKKTLAQKILFIDLDVHQGNGTASIFEDQPSVFTFSMHGKDNFPFHKKRSTLDIELPTGIGDEEYLTLLQQNLTNIIQDFQPDFAFYISGVDILETDKLGKLKISKEGCRRRDAYVFDTLHAHNIPVTVTMGGGYSPRVGDIVDAHCQTYKEAMRIFF